MLSVTALAWSIPFVQGVDLRADADEMASSLATRAPATGDAPASPISPIVEARLEPEEPDDGRA